MQTQSPFAVLTPTLDGDILAVLARVESSLTIGQICRLIPYRSEAGIRKGLRRLAAQGIVDSRQVGAILAHSLNRKHLAAPHVIAIAHLRDALHVRMREHLESWLTPPPWAAVFGSAARGDMRVESDIDIFLVDPGINPDQWDVLTSVFVSEVASWTGNDARILSLTEGEIRWGASKGDPIIKSLLADAITVCGPADWLRRTVRGARP